MSINQQILAFVAQNPDSTAAQINGALGAKMKTTTSALSKMARAGAVNRVKTFRNRRYTYVKPQGA